MDEGVMPDATNAPDAETGGVIRRKMFACPHCGEWCSLPVSIKILEPVKKLEDCYQPNDPLQGLTVEQREVVTAAQRSGLLAAFSDAVNNRANNSQNHVPADRMGRFLVTFLKTAGAKRVPSFVLAHYTKAFPNEVISFWGSQGVLVVVAGAKISAFLPIHLAVGNRITRANGGYLKARVDADQGDFEQWVKTKHGYVPRGAPMFLDALRKKSIGAFADVS